MQNNNIQQQELQAGAVLWHGSYRIIRVLGQGGFGITYLAMDENLGREVCIKEFFPKEYCGRDNTSHLTVASKSAEDLINRMKEKFVKEARNIVRFNHPNIIKVHTAFEENNTAYYVMDYIEGESLSSWVKRTGPLSGPVALKYIEQIGDALEYIHRNRINHLDVKPANIMLDSADNRPVLIDFGLAKQYDTQGNQTSTTPVGLSHGFAPLEQYKVGGVSSFSPESDLYSLAATFYYLLTGTVPPEAALLASESLEFPSYFPPQYIPAVKKAMSIDRRARQASVAQFLRDLNEPDAAAMHPQSVHPQSMQDEATTMIHDSAGGQPPLQYNQHNNVIDTPYEPPTQPEKQKNSWILPALIVGGAVIVAVVLLILFLPGGNSGESTVAQSGEVAAEENMAPEPEVIKLPLSVNNAPHLAPQGKWHYDATNLIDGSKQTAWVCDAGIYNDGSGIDLLEFTLNANKIDHIILTNGYVKDAKTYRNNARAGSVYISRVPWERASSEDIIYSGPLSDSMSPQTLPVSSGYDNSRPTKKIYVKFGPDVVHGAKWPNDFCITEFQVYGY